MSPYYFHVMYADNWGMNLDGGLNNHLVEGVSSYSGVRPVINLKSDVEITSGDGTSTNPYIIKIN